MAIDLNHNFSDIEQELIAAVARALVMNLVQVEEWLIASNAIAAATSEVLLGLDTTDAVRLEMVEELAQGIRANLGLFAGGMTKQ